MDTPASALIAAQPASLRYSLLALLAGLPQIGSIQSAEETGSILAVVSITQPRLVVLDANMLGDEGGLVLAQIKASAPRACTVILVDQIKQQAMFGTSADLVLLKGYPAAELFRRIEQLLAAEN